MKNLFPSSCTRTAKSMNIRLCVPFWSFNIGQCFNIHYTGRCLSFLLPPVRRRPPSSLVPLGSLGSRFLSYPLALCIPRYCRRCLCRCSSLINFSKQGVDAELRTHAVRFSTVSLNNQDLYSGERALSTILRIQHFASYARAHAPFIIYVCERLSKMSLRFPRNIVVVPPRFIG